MNGSMNHIILYIYIYIYICVYVYISADPSHLQGERARGKLALSTKQRQAAAWLDTGSELFQWLQKATLGSSLPSNAPQRPCRRFWQLSGRLWPSVGGLSCSFLVASESDVRQQPGFKPSAAPLGACPLVFQWLQKATLGSSLASNPPQPLGACPLVFQWLRKATLGSSLPSNAPQRPCQRFWQLSGRLWPSVGGLSSSFLVASESDVRQQPGFKPSAAPLGACPLVFQWLQKATLGSSLASNPPQRLGGACPLVDVRQQPAFKRSAAPLPALLATFRTSVAICRRLVLQFSSGLQKATIRQQPGFKPSAAPLGACPLVFQWLQKATLGSNLPSNAPQRPCRRFWQLSGRLWPSVGGLSSSFLVASESDVRQQPGFKPSAAPLGACPLVFQWLQKATLGSSLPSNAPQRPRRRFWQLSGRLWPSVWGLSSRFRMASESDIRQQPAFKPSAAPLGACPLVFQWLQKATLGSSLPSNAPQRPRRRFWQLSGRLWPSVGGLSVVFQWLQKATLGSSLASNPPQRLWGLVHQFSSGFSKRRYSLPSNAPQRPCRRFWQLSGRLRPSVGGCVQQFSSGFRKRRQAVAWLQTLRSAFGGLSTSFLVASESDVRQQPAFKHSAAPSRALLATFRTSVAICRRLVRSLLVASESDVRQQPGFKPSAAPLGACPLVFQWLRKATLGSSLPSNAPQRPCRRFWQLSGRLWPSVGGLSSSFLVASESDVRQQPGFKPSAAPLGVCRSSSFLVASESDVRQQPTFKPGWHPGVFRQPLNNYILAYSSNYWPYHPHLECMVFHHPYHHENDGIQHPTFMEICVEYQQTTTFKILENQKMI